MLVTDKELKSIVSDTRNLNIGRNYWHSGYVKKNQNNCRSKQSLFN